MFLRLDALLLTFVQYLRCDEGQQRSKQLSAKNHLLEQPRGFF